jgi:hypothetical protein
MPIPQKKIDAFMSALDEYVAAKVSEGTRDASETGDFSSYFRKETLEKALVDILNPEVTP